MNCRKAKAWMSMDLDGELPARRQPALAEHLACCDDCRAAREQWLGVGKQLRRRATASPQTPEAAWADVRRAIRLAQPEAAPAPAWGWDLRWAGAAAAVLAVSLALGLGLLLRGGPVGGAPVRLARVESVETSLPGASPMVYEDEESGWVVIWVVEQNQREAGHAGS